jgi:hypothetical protein
VRGVAWIRWKLQRAGLGDHLGQDLHSRMAVLGPHGWWSPACRLRREPVEDPLHRHRGRLAPGAQRRLRKQRSGQTPERTAALFPFRTDLIPFRAP